MISKREFTALGLVITAFIGGTIFMVLAFNGPRHPPEHATVLPQTLALPQFSLLDQRGRTFDRASFSGHWSLVFFGFTHCPDICPATLQQLAIASNRLKSDGETDLPRIVLISVDPERDTPETLAAYVAHFDADISAVTGLPDELRKLTSALGIYFEKSLKDDGAYGIDHSTVVIVVDPNAEFHAVFRAPHNVQNFVDDLPRIMGSR